MRAHSHLSATRLRTSGAPTATSTRSTQAVNAGGDVDVVNDRRREANLGEVFVEPLQHLSAAQPDDFCVVLRVRRRDRDERAQTRVPC